MALPVRARQRAAPRMWEPPGDLESAFQRMTHLFERT